VSEQGLNEYFLAVGSEAAAEEKLASISECFTPDTKLIAANGTVFEGREGVKDFYSSPHSPVLRPGFKPVPDRETLCYSPDGKTIAVEIQLASPKGTLFVGDFFTFDASGLITRLRIYQTSSA